MNNRQFLFFILFILFLLPGPQDQQMNYPEYQSKVYVMDTLIDEYNENKERILDPNLTYSNGYGNLTGFRLSYEDASMHRNVSNWPFDDRDGVPFVEDQSLSILPNKISKLAAAVWNTDGKIIQLPEVKDGFFDPKDSPYNGIFEKRNSAGGDKDDGANNDIENEGSFWVNVTSTLRGSFEVIDKDLEKIHMPLPEYYANLTNLQDRNNLFEDSSIENPNNVVDGSNFEETNNNSPQPLPNDFPLASNKVGNITYDKGSVKIYLGNVNTTTLTSHVKQKSNLEQSDISSRIVVSFFLNNDNEDDEHAVVMRGVYHKDSGNVVATTRSSKFLSDFAIPFLNLNNDRYFQESKKAMSVLFNNTNYDEEIDMTYLDQMVDDSEKCEYITYLHLERTNLSSEEMQEIDDELFSPLGRPISKIPPVKITNGLLYSPDCGILIKVNDSTGMRNESFSKSYLKNSIYMCFVILLQILIIAKQMNVSNTPSILSRLSMYSIAIMLSVDGMIAGILSLVALLFGDIYKQVAICSFFAFVCSSAFEMRLLLSIYNNQANERTISFRTALQGTPIDDRNNGSAAAAANNGTANPVGAANTTTTTTAAAAAATPAEQLPVVQDDQSGVLYFRFMFLLISASIIAINAIFWPKTQRSIFEYVALIVINSYWVPQIYRNVVRGSRRSFTWDFILGTSCVRFIPIYYIISIDAENAPFFHHKSSRLVITILVWLSVQISILYLQELLGSRFMLPVSMLPKTYDYHPVLTFGDLENDFNFDDFQNVSSDSPNGSHTGKCKVTCSICMNDLELPIVKSDYQDRPSPPHLQHSDTSSQQLIQPPSSDMAGGASSGLSVSTHLNNMLLRRHYMITPCRHIFHTECLESWMRYKLQCPVCRNTLPPL